MGRFSRACPQTVGMILRPPSTISGTCRRIEKIFLSRGEDAEGGGEPRSGHPSDPLALQSEGQVPFDGAYKERLTGGRLARLGNRNVAAPGCWRARPRSRRAGISTTPRRPGSRSTPAVSLASSGRGRWRRFPARRHIDRGAKRVPPSSFRPEREARSGETSLPHGDEVSPLRRAAHGSGRNDDGGAVPRAATPRSGLP